MPNWFQLKGLPATQERWAAWAIAALEVLEMPPEPGSMPTVSGGVLHLPPDLRVVEQLLDLLDEGVVVTFSPVADPGQGRILASRLRERVARRERRLEGMADGRRRCWGLSRNDRE